MVFRVNSIFGFSESIFAGDIDCKFHPAEMQSILSGYTLCRNAVSKIKYHKHAIVK